MKPYSDLTVQYLDSLGDIPTVKARKSAVYLNIEAAFDIETTSTIIDGERKAAFSYIWMFGIGLGNTVFYGRTLSEFVETCDFLSDYFGLCAGEKHLVIYVHNLEYEFQFIRKLFDWDDVFALKKRKAIRAITSTGIEFRDSLILSGLSLEVTAKNLVRHKVKKLVGDLDYSIPRHHLTPLTEHELAYCNNDIEIILAYIKEQIEEYSDVYNIPMTNTGKVRRHVKEMCYRQLNKETGEYFRDPRDYQKIIKKLTLDPDTYAQSKRAFMGGFTHSNPAHTMKVIDNVSSIDLTSSYPTVMVAEQFPMSAPVTLILDSMEDLIKSRAKYCIMLDVRFKNIRNKFHHESYISESRCVIMENAVVANGRVYSADDLTITLTDIDLEIISEVYEWDAIDWDNVTGFRKGYLPKPIIESILDLYKDKTELKGVEGAEVEYLKAKGMINSLYGMCVTDIVKDDHAYFDEWEVEAADVTEKIMDYNSSRNRFLYYPWGIWVTAYARRNLWSAIIEFGADYIYSDTDSVKSVNFSDHAEYIELYNQQIADKLKRCLQYYKLDESKLTPKTIEGKSKPLGVWEFEGEYSRFKTVGAKRYLVEENGKLTITVAGLSKQNGVNYLLETCDGDNTKVFEMFTDDLFIPAGKTGKLTHTYLDEEDSFLFTDVNGVQVEIHVQSATHLSNCEFNMSISDVFIRFINEVFF